MKLTSRKISSFSGTTRIPGDKSISHRALMLGGLCKEETIISGLLEGEDVLNTATAMKALGAQISSGEDGLWRCFGTGTGHLRTPSHALYMGNSGTSTRLLAGLVAGHNITATFTGDASLSKRPMKRIVDPLSQMGAQFEARDGMCLPMIVRGAEKIKPIEYRLPVASAQVKSAILLAGVSARGVTTVIEDKPTRDHTENMLRHFGAKVSVENLPDGAQAIHLDGPQELFGCAVDVPGDPTSAAFPVVAAVLIDGAALSLPHIGVNSRRTGIYETLREMGADIAFEHERTEAGERVADIIVRGGAVLKGVDVPPSRVPSMIDEFPVLAVAASCAEGVTRMTGLAELRVKESDRLKMVADGLVACGVKIDVGPDSLTIHGTGCPPSGGAEIVTALDHRIAMSFLVMGMVADDPVCIDDSSAINTSFPHFITLMNDLGAAIA